MNVFTRGAALAVSATAVLAMLAPAAQAGTASHTKKGTIKVCHHQAGDGVLRLYAEGPVSRVGQLRPGTCLSWTSVPAGSYEFGVDGIDGNCEEWMYWVDRVTVHRPDSYRATRYLPVRTTVVKGQTTAVGIYVNSDC